MIMREPVVVWVRCSGKRHYVRVDWTAEGRPVLSTPDHTAAEMDEWDTVAETAAALAGTNPVACCRCHEIRRAWNAPPVLLLGVVGDVGTDTSVMLEPSPIERLPRSLQTPCRIGHAFAKRASR